MNCGADAGFFFVVVLFIHTLSDLSESETELIHKIKEYWRKVESKSWNISRAIKECTLLSDILHLDQIIISNNTVLQSVYTFVFYTGDIFLVIYLATFRLIRSLCV